MNNTDDCPIYVGSSYADRAKPLRVVKVEAIGKCFDTPGDYGQEVVIFRLAKGHDVERPWFLSPDRFAKVFQYLPTVKQCKQ